MRRHAFNFRNLAMIIFAILCMSTIAAGQKRPRPKPRPASAPLPAAAPALAKRPVTVNLKQGDQVTGAFLRADAETMQIEIRSGQLTIKMSEVASLVFTEEGEREVTARPAEEEPKDPAPAPNRNLLAAGKAYAELRKLAEAAKIRLPLGQYGNLLIEAKTEIDDALTEISDYSLKNEITRTLDAYYDAGQAWGAARAYDTGQATFGAGRVIEQGVPVNSEPGATLMRKYQIKPGVDRLGQPDHLELDTTLKTIWAAAGARLNYIATLIRQ